MLSPIKGIVQAGDGALDIVVEPPARTLAEAMSGEDTDGGMREILLETGVSLGPVEVDVRVVTAEPLDDDHPGFEEILGDVEVCMPRGRVFLNGPMTDVLLQIGELEQPQDFVFRIIGRRRETMKDLVASQVVERYLIFVWPSSTPENQRRG